MFDIEANSAQWKGNQMKPRKLGTQGLKVSALGLQSAWWRFFHGEIQEGRGLVAGRLAPELAAVSRRDGRDEG
jgi:hypothetical protein